MHTVLRAPPYERIRIKTKCIIQFIKLQYFIPTWQGNCVQDGSAFHTETPAFLFPFRIVFYIEIESFLHKRLLHRINLLNSNTYINVNCISKQNIWMASVRFSIFGEMVGQFDSIVVITFISSEMFFISFTFQNRSHQTHKPSQKDVEVSINTQAITAMWPHKTWCCQIIRFSNRFFAHLFNNLSSSYTTQSSFNLNSINGKRNFIYFKHFVCCRI